MVDIGFSKGVLVLAKNNEIDLEIVRVFALGITVCLLGNGQLSGMLAWQRVLKVEFPFLRNVFKCGGKTFKMFCGWRKDKMYVFVERYKENFFEGTQQINPSLN